MDRFPLRAVRPAVRALAVAFVPELDRATPTRWQAIEHTIGQALGQRPPGLTRQLVWLVRILDWITRVRYRRSLAGLDPATRIAAVRRFERGNQLQIRRGVAGLRTLVFMGVYTDPDVIREIGYRASPKGWSAVR